MGGRERSVNLDPALQSNALGRAALNAQTQYAHAGFVSRGYRLIKPEVLDALVAAGCTAEQIAAAVKADMPKRSSAAERQARYRDRKASHIVTSDATLRNVTVETPSPFVPPDKEMPPRPPKEINPPIIPQPRSRAAFEEFWSAYPNKVGKPKAEQAFSKALKRIEPETLMAGLSRYLAKTDDRQWCNPATWLNQDRWDDQPAAVARGSPSRTRTIADAASDLLMEFQNADIRSEPSHPHLAAPIPDMPPPSIGK